MLLLSPCFVNVQNFLWVSHIVRFGGSKWIIDNSGVWEVHWLYFTLFYFIDEMSQTTESKCGTTIHLHVMFLKIICEGKAPIIFLPSKINPISHSLLFFLQVFLRSAKHLRIQRENFEGKKSLHKKKLICKNSNGTKSTFQEFTVFPY